MAVIGAAFLLAVSWALARIHVEHDHLWWSPFVHFGDPLAGQIGERDEVLWPAKPFCLEPAHLGGRGSKVGNRPVANYPAHCRIAA